MKIAPDRPITTTAEDIYGFKDTIVPRLVELCVNWPSSGGVVIGLIGPWGCGKTSVLNMAQSKIEALAGRESVLEFSPWSYEDSSSLILGFFGVIKKHLQDSADTRLKIIGTHLGRLGTGLGIAASGLKVWGVSINPEAIAEAAKAIGAASDLIDSFGQAEAEIAGARKEAARALDQLAADKRRLIVLIDDIDRLSYRELITLFRLMRAVADLPAVTLVAAMDERRVRQMLRKGSSDDFGDDYLEKIIQARLHVPSPSPRRQRAAVIGGLTTLLEQARLDYPKELQETGFWLSDELELLQTLLATPRDIVRFNNALAVLLFGKGGEHVDPLDAAILTAIDVALPDGYLAIRDNRGVFVGSESWAAPPEREKQNGARARAFKNILESLPDDGRRILFERAAAILFPRIVDPDRPRIALYGEQNRVRRIHDQRHFDTYFLAAAPTILTPTEVQAVARWLIDGEGDDELSHHILSQLDEDGVAQLTSDLEPHFNRLHRSNVGGVGQRLVELCARFNQTHQADVVFTLAAKIVGRRPESAATEWESFFQAIRDGIPELVWADLLRQSLSEHSDLPRAWYAVAERWVSQQRRRLAAKEMPWEDPEDVKEWFVLLRLIAFRIDNNEEGIVLEVSHEIGDCVLKRPSLLPMLLHSVGVSSGKWVGLTGNVRSPQEALRHIARHFRSDVHLQEAIQGWLECSDGTDPHGLVEELRALRQSGSIKKEESDNQAD